MAARQGAAGVGMALRAVAQQGAQAGSTWSARPGGSLMASQTSTSSSTGGNCPSFAATSMMQMAAAGQLSQHRHMSGKPSMFGGFNLSSFSSFFDYRKMVYPEVYDPNERHMWSRYKAHGSVAERYVAPGPLTAANPLADPALEQRVKNFTKRFYTAVVCNTSIWGYRKGAMKERVLDAYKAVNSALATGDVSLAEPYVSEAMAQRLGAEVARRGRSRVMWRMAREPTVKDVQLVLGAVVQNPLKQGKLHFAQWTARISSRQVVAIYDGKDRLLAGDPDKELEVVDHWVFERPILKAWVVPRPGPAGAEWRLVERLS